MLGYAVVDVETTGFAARTRDRVVEIALVLTDPDGRVQHEWSTLVNPLRDVGPSWVHGIHARDVANAPTFGDIAEDVMAALSGRTLVAHNVGFDFGFLAAEFGRAQVPVREDFPRICTMRWSDTFVRGTSRKLVHCCEAAGIEIRDAHSALGDARATAELLGFYLRRSAGHVPWAAVVEQCDAYPWLAPPADGAAPVLARSRRAAWPVRQPAAWADNRPECVLR